MAITKEMREFASGELLDAAFQLLCAAVNNKVLSLDKTVVDDSDIESALIDMLDKAGIHNINDMVIMISKEIY